jgi:hypothetical protein
MTLVKHRFFIAFTVIELIALSGLMAWGHATLERRRRDEEPAKRELVRVLELTDLALWTEARYTRHPSQADLFSPFQDLPSSIEHFPAGSIVPPAGLEDLASGSGR